MTSSIGGNNTTVDWQTGSAGASLRPPTPANVSVDEANVLYPLALVVPITIVYGVILTSGVVGNVSTCVIIARNKSMHTVTNFYLFSLAISDMLLLLSGLPPEMYRIWSPHRYIFGGAFCVLQSFAAETSANATVLTITAFTVERYLAICHPFLSHTMSNLVRAVRHIVAIWLVALCLAVPQAIQFGVEYELVDDEPVSRCTMVVHSFEHAFEISTFVFFVGPMTLITVLYVLIGVQLRKSSRIGAPRSPTSPNDAGRSSGNNAAAQNRVIKMLIAVVAAFFICWAPFHAQRLLAVYLTNASEEPQETTVTIYMILMHTSGILYFLSTTINPLLYHIMSNKFREAFKNTLSDLCRSRRKHSNKRTYSSLSKCQTSKGKLQRSMSDSFQRREIVETDMAISPAEEGKQDDSLSVLGERRSSAGPTVGRRPFGLRIFNGKGGRRARSGPQRERRNSPCVPFNVGAINAISNSSLHSDEIEETDFTNFDMVTYMEEVNDSLA